MNLQDLLRVGRERSQRLEGGLLNMRRSHLDQGRNLSDQGRRRLDLGRRVDRKSSLDI